LSPFTSAFVDFADLFRCVAFTTMIEPFRQARAKANMLQHSLFI